MAATQRELKDRALRIRASAGHRLLRHGTTEGIDLLHQIVWPDPELERESLRKARSDVAKLERRRLGL